MGGKPGGKVGSKQFPYKPTESLLCVKGCIRQLTVLPRKIGNPYRLCGTDLLSVNATRDSRQMAPPDAHSVASLDY
jgi:hypothetical protein